MILKTGFIWIILSVAFYGVIHSILASSKVKTWVEGQFGTLYKRGYRIFFNTVVGLTLIPVLALVVLLPDAPIYQIHFPWIVLTLLIEALCGIGLLATVMQTGTMNFLGLEQLTDPQNSNRSHQLSTNGLYRWIRHPLYTLSFIFIWLTPIMTWNILAFNIGVTLYTTIAAAVFEEHKLLIEFGNAYREYQKRTPMLIPGLKFRKTQKDSH
jgi:methanethiol S-methyltransferase